MGCFTALPLHFRNEGAGPLTVVVEFGDDSHERGDKI